MDYIYSEIDAGVLDAGEIDLNNITASVDDQTGSPSVETTYNAEDKSVHFAFHGLKGPEGNEGPAGPKGVKGDPSTWEDIKPVGGIKKSDLNVHVQNTLDKADNSVQVGDLEEYYNKEEVDELVQPISNKSNIGHLHNISDINNLSESLQDLRENKVDAIEGRGLSEENFTRALKTKIENSYGDSHSHDNKETLDSITPEQSTMVSSLYNSGVRGIDSNLSGDSNNPIKNSAVTTLFGQVTDSISTLIENMSRVYYTKQDKIIDLTGISSETKSEYAEAIASGINSSLVSELDSHLNDLDVGDYHLTSGDRDRWDAAAISCASKQNALTPEQLEAVNSGITSAKVNQITVNQYNISKKQDKITDVSESTKPAQAAAINSGITSSKVAAYDSVVNDMGDVYMAGTVKSNINTLKTDCENIHHLIDDHAQSIGDINRRMQNKAGTARVKAIEDNLAEHVAATVTAGSTITNGIHVSEKDRTTWGGKQDKIINILDDEENLSDVIYNEEHSNLKLREDLSNKIKAIGEGDLPKEGEAPIEGYRDIIESINSIYEDINGTNEIKDNITEIKGNLNTHTGDEDIHISYEDRDYWNSKQNAITDEQQLSALNSGITSNKVEKYESYEGTILELSGRVINNSDRMNDHIDGTQSYTDTPKIGGHRVSDDIPSKYHHITEEVIVSMGCNLNSEEERTYAVNSIDELDLSAKYDGDGKIINDEYVHNELIDEGNPDLGYKTLTDVNFTSELYEKLEHLEGHTHDNKEVLDEIESIDDELSVESSGLVKNRVIKEGLNNLNETFNDRLTNLDNRIQNQLSGKQKTLNQGNGIYLDKNSNIRAKVEYGSGLEFNSSGEISLDDKAYYVIHGNEDTELTPGKKYVRTSDKYNPWVEIDTLSNNTLGIKIGEDIPVSKAIGGYSIGDTIDKEDTLYEVLYTVFNGEAPNLHTVTFNMCGHGEEIEEIKVLDGHTITEPTPTTEGYTFIHWYLDSSFENEFDFTTPIESDITLYAKWEINTYTITFGSSPLPGGIVIINPQPQHGPINQITVNYGTILKCNPGENTLHIGNDYTATPDPADNYEFENWSAYDNYVREDLTIYANFKFSLQVYQVDFNMNGVEGSPVPQTQNVIEGQTADEPTPEPAAEGYLFRGWYTESSCENPFYFSTGIRRNTTLYAKWVEDVDMCTVNFEVLPDSRYGTVSQHTLTDVPVGSTVTVNENSIEINDTTITATPKEWSGKIVTFGHWTSVPSLITSDITIGAHFTATDIYKTLTYSANGGTGEMEPETYPTGTPVLVKSCEFTKPGFTFKKWNTSSDGSGTSYQPGSSLNLTINRTLYAIWEEKSEVKIIFNGNGATSGTMENQICSPESIVNLNPNLFVKTNSSFAGWAETADGEVKYADGAEITLGSADMTLYAVWTAQKIVKVLYEPNGGEGYKSPDSYAAGSTVTLSANVFTFEGQVFAGWALEPNGEVVYNDGATVTLGDTSLMLYAIWTGDTRAILYNPNGGTGYMRPQRGLSPGDSVNLAANTFTNDGYVFTGWALSPNGAVAYTDGATVTVADANIALYAVWEDIPPVGDTSVHYGSVLNPEEITSPEDLNWHTTTQIVSGETLSISIKAGQGRTVENPSIMFKNNYTLNEWKTTGLILDVPYTRYNIGDYILLVSNTSVVSDGTNYTVKFN